MDNNINRRIIAVILCTLLFGCSQQGEKNNAIRTYIVNNSTMKVHSMNCGSAKLMSKANREEVNDTLLNICARGYKVCKNCNCGLKRKYFNLEYELPNKQTYLKSIDTIGKWYVNHVATYQRKIQEIPLNEYSGDDTYITKYTLVDRFKRFIGVSKEYNVITSDSNCRSLNTYDVKEIEITCANENAVKNYKDNYNKILFWKNLAYYDCEYIRHCTEYNQAGDDCIRFVFAVLNLMDKDFLKDVHEISGIPWTKINTSIFKKDDKQFIKSMKIKGFQIYDTNEIEFDYDGIIDDKTRIIDNNLKLELGDIIVREGHVHIYLGTDMLNADNFGWGKVNRNYPNVYDFSIINNDNNYYVVCESDKDKSGRYNLYTRIYRYVGGK